MPSIIVFNDGDCKSLHISSLTKRMAAKRIANRFNGFSTDNETTSIVEDDEKIGAKIVDFLTIILTNENADDGSGPDHDLAYILDFTPEAMKWAIDKTDNDEWGENKHLLEAGVI